MWVLLKNLPPTFPYSFKTQMNATNIAVSLQSLNGLSSLKQENSSTLYSVVRRLLNYESPYLAVKLSGERSSLVFRKR